MRASLPRAWSQLRIVLLITGAVFLAPFILVAIVARAADARR